MPSSKALEQRGARRRWPLEEKRRIVELTLREGASTRRIAREQGVDPTSLYHWKTLYRAGKLDAQLPVPAPPRVRSRASSARFLPVTISSTPEAPQGGVGAGGPSIVQIMVPSGATLRIESGVLDAEVVCALLAHLQQ